MPKLRPKLSLRLKRLILVWTMVTTVLMAILWRFGPQVGGLEAVKFHINRLSGQVHASRQLIAKMIAPQIASFEFPKRINLETSNNKGAFFDVSYTLNENLQLSLIEDFKRFAPDYGAFVAIEPESGRILALVSYVNPRWQQEGFSNLATYEKFPVASIFKVVTAAAGIEEKKLNTDTMIAYNGSNHTLYKKNVFELQLNRWTNHVTLKDAFARSINSVFAKIGIQKLRPQKLRNYAERFQFNRDLETDFGNFRATVEIPDNDDWKLASVSSGFDHESSMSPLHGALIAAAIANDGIMMRPHIVDVIHSANGKIVYDSVPEMLSQVMSPGSAEEMRALMRATVESGTSRSAFRSLRGLRRMSEVENGGKTGSLDSRHPRGRTDWFVGYSQLANSKVAVAAVMVNVDKWKVRASYLAGKFFETFHASNARVAAGP